MVVLMMLSIKACKAHAGLVCVVTRNCRRIASESSSVLRMACRRITSRHCLSSPLVSWIRKRCIPLPSRWRQPHPVEPDGMPLVLCRWSFLRTNTPSRCAKVEFRYLFFTAERPCCVSVIRSKEIMLFIGKPKGRSEVISNATNPLKELSKRISIEVCG